MGFESPKEITNFESMDFLQLEADPVSGPVLQEQALNYLKTEDKEWFEKEFTGEITPDGYLIGKDGKANTKPSQCMGSPGVEKVTQMTKKTLKEKSY
jgi:hypothetical protein